MGKTLGLFELVVIVSVFYVGFTYACYWLCYWLAGNIICGF